MLRRHSFGIGSRRLFAVLATVATTAVLSACGSSGKGPVTLNWYVFPEPSGSFQAAATECSNGSHGAYNIKINFLSTSSDQQRVSLVRRLAANDSSIDILAMDVDWTAEFATAKWLKPVPANLAAQIKSHRSGRAGSDRHLEEQTVGDPDQLEHRAALVPQGPRPDPAQDLDADDRGGRPAGRARASRTSSRSRAPSTRA